MVKKPNDYFELYDLRVTTLPPAKGKKMGCNHPAGSYFELSGENLKLGQKTFPVYSLAAILPLLPAMQRQIQSNDWMSTDHIIACPDPNCGGRFQITRIGKRRFRYAQTTLTKRKKK